MIIAISGLSGTGKTTIAKELSKITNIPISIRYTNRPMRPGETNGIDYHFVDEISDGKFVGIERYNVDGGYTWSYGSKKEDIKDVSIMVINPLAIKALRDSGITVYDIRIELNENVRLNRITQRNDNQTKNEIERRTNADKAILNSYEPTVTIYNISSVETAKLIAHELQKLKIM